MLSLFIALFSAMLRSVADSASSCFTPTVFGKPSLSRPLMSTLALLLFIVTLTSLINLFGMWKFRKALIKFSLMTLSKTRR
uniref:Secreted protein n=1 Tax=Panstrongylus lignarius TaxID=156445 RepID=A0A224Y366_9HEMI